MATDDSLPNDALIKVHVDRVMRETLDRLARREDRSLSAEVRRALREHVQRSALVEPAASGSEGASSGLSSPVRAAPAPRAPAPESSPFVPPALLPKPASTAAELAATIPSVTVAAKIPVKERRITTGAAKDFCVHRVKLESFCKRCANGEAA